MSVRREPPASRSRRISDGLTRVRTIRQILTPIHRWTGLALAAFIVVVALTGALLPFQTELQRRIAPERFVTAPSPGARPLDWVELHRIAEARSGGVAPTMLLHISDDAALSYGVMPRPGQQSLGFDEILIDPYTGREIARDRSGDLRDGSAQILPFLFLVHQELALGAWGAWLLGVVALAWTLDCFVGFYLTLPVSWANWWRRGAAAWTIKRPVRSRFGLHFDLHRASGLWLWPMLFVYAWCGVAFNLPQVYVPVMRALTGLAAEPDGAGKQIDRAPLLSWAGGLAAARSRAAEVTAAPHITIEWERELRYLRSSNSYSFAFRSSRDRSDDFANSWITVDGDDGRLLSATFPTGEHTGNTIDYWLGLLHEAGVFGIAFRFFVSACGIGICLLTITGVFVWHRKHGARRIVRHRGKAALHGTGCGS